MNKYFTRGEIQMVKNICNDQRKWSFNDNLMMKLKQEWDSILCLIWLETDQCFLLTMI